jgi:NAD(P)-dependent dehydrogenase (short-subunit alcohol dehydrogenase family)
LNVDLKGRVALVTGGSRGIGKAVALELGGAGADVVVGATGPGKAEEVVAAVKRMGRRAEAVYGDLSDPATAEAYVRACAERMGSLDVLVNNAGIWEEAAADAVTPEILHRTMSLNLAAVFFLCRHAVPLLRQSPAGRIVNISSTVSLMGEPLHSPYAASKGGMDALTRSLAVELGPEGITVNSVAPGWTRTDMAEDELATEFGEKLIASIPLRRVAEPQDVAYAVCFLASDRARHISGVTLPVEGAYRIRR